MSGYDIVMNFGFEDRHGLKGLSRTDGSVTNLVPWEFGMHATDPLSAELSIPLTRAWLFLDCLTGCDFEEYHGPGDATSINDWLADENRRDLVREAFCQFAGSVQVEFAMRKADLGQSASLHFRYLADRPESGPLADFLTICEAEIQRFPKVDAAEDWSYELVRRFPDDLFRTVVGPLGSQVAGPWLPIGNVPIWSGSVEEAVFVPTQLLRGEVSVSELSDLAEQVLRNQFTVDDVEIGADSIHVALSGLDPIRRSLEEVGGFAEALDIGIGGLRLEVSDDTDSGGLICRIAASLELPVSAKVEWYDVRSGSWRSLSEGSAGQRQILALLLTFARPNSKRNELVLSDEFDRGLHPTTGRALASLVDALLRKRGGIGVVSTHNADLSSAVSSPNWYATRGADGAFRIETELNPGYEQQILGVPADEVARMKRLVLLVEGYMDVLVLTRLFGDDPYLRNNVRIVSANGAKNFATVWDFHLADSETPIIVVHDKRSMELEFAFSELKQIGSSADPWTEAGLRDLMKSLTKGSHPAAGEMKALDQILQKVVASGAVGRVEIHGLDVEDIVDCLPERHFRKVVRWADAYATARAEGLDGVAFKNRHGVTVEAVERALADADFQPHPELARLYDKVCRSLGYKPLGD